MTDSVLEQRYEGRAAPPLSSSTVAAGRVLGQLDEHGELVPLDEPAADDPSSWPRSWWAHITELPR